MERCPFCGCETTQVVTIPQFLCYVECRACKARGPEVTYFTSDTLEKKAEDLWNNRDITP